MAVYRITRFAAADMDKLKDYVETIRTDLENMGAEFIDIVSYRNGKGVVLAKYPDDTTMEGAADAAKKAFGGMIEAGLVDGDSIHPHAGEVVSSF